MSLVINRDSDNPVHFPANKDVFRFDAEVAEIFENMAQRSIPMYSEIHRLHVSLLKDKIYQAKRENRTCNVFDIGASTGKWFRTMREMLNVSSLDSIPNLACYAFDNSSAMLEKLSKSFPEVISMNMDLLSPQELDVKADIVIMLYVLQFLPHEKKRQALKWAFDRMSDGAVMVLGQKENFVNEKMQELFQGEYIRFRMDNGYTLEEIEAKTKALRNAMWPISRYSLRALLEDVGFNQIVETTRWLSFSTVMVTK